MTKKTKTVTAWAVLYKHAGDMAELLYTRREAVQFAKNYGWGPVVKLTGSYTPKKIRGKK